MATPATPTNFAVQTGNQVNSMSWDSVSTAMSYTVQRSLDNQNFTTVSAAQTTLSFTDTSVSLGVEYWYQVYATNGSGNSAPTASQFAIPVPNGEMSLAQIRLLSQQRADMVNSQFVTNPEWNQYINQSLYELYDLLITVYEDYFLAPSASFTTDGSTFLYNLPDGTNFNGAPALYKLRGVDLALNNAQNAFVTVHKFSFEDRNRFVYPNTSSTIFGVFNLRYRMMGKQIEFIPIPNGNQTIRLWYIPRMNQLNLDTDFTTNGISGWIEYVIIDAAIKAMQKEESDISVLSMQKQAMIDRINSSATNRDAGEAEQISDIRPGFYGYNLPSDFTKGGW